MEDHNTDISRNSLPKNCRGNYILSNETLQQLDRYYTPPESFLAAANTRLVYQAHLRAEVNELGQQVRPLLSISNQGTAYNHSPSVHAPGASSLPIQQTVSPQPFAPQVKKLMHPSFFHTHSFKLQNSVDLKHPVYLRKTWLSVYAHENNLILSPEHQTPLFRLFRQQIIQNPQ